MFIMWLWASVFWKWTNTMSRDPWATDNQDCVRLVCTHFNACLNSLHSHLSSWKVRVCYLPNRVSQLTLMWSSHDTASENVGMGSTRDQYNFFNDPGLEKSKRNIRVDLTYFIACHNHHKNPPGPFKHLTTPLEPWLLFKGLERSTDLLL